MNAGLSPLLESHLAQALLEHSDLGVVGLDDEGRVLVWNAWLAGRTGIQANAAWQRTLPDLFPHLPPAMLDELETALTTGQPRVLSPVLHASWLPLEPTARQVVRLLPLPSAEGKAAGSLILFQDVTAQFAYEETAEAELRRINRALRVLSLCNQVVVRATDEAHLMAEVCHILVDKGGYCLAWAGLAGQDEARRVRPVAQAGCEAGYLDTLHVTWADDEWGRGPTGRAIRSGEPVVARDLLTDPDYAPWRAEAVERGYASSIALPLMPPLFPPREAGGMKGEALGALNIYAAEPQAFDQEEVRLLGELAADLAYGLTALRTRAEREHAEEALRQSEERYRQLVENSPAGIVIHSQGKVVFANPAIAKLVGTAGPQELLGREMLDFVHPDYRETVLERARSVQEGDRAIPTLEEKFLRLDGSAVDVEVTGVPFVYQSQPGVQVIVTDITERKQAAEEIKQRNRGLSTLLKVSQALAATLDLDSVLQTSITGAVDLMELGSGAIYLLEGETLYLGATTPPLTPQFPEELRRAPLADHPHIRQAITTGRPVILPDTTTANLTPAERAVSEMRGLRSIIYAPLLAAEQPVGAWILASVGESRAFSEAEIDMSRTLATQVALAIENARLYTSVQRQAAELEQRVAERTAELDERLADMESLNRAMRNLLQDLQAANRKLTQTGEALQNANMQLERQYRRQAALAGIGLAINQPHELETALGRIVELTAELLPASGGAVVLWDAQAEKFWISASTVPEQAPRTAAQRVRREGGATRWIVEHGQPLTVPDVRNDPFGANRMLPEFGMQAYAGVPLSADQETLGVLYALDRHRREYTQEDLDFLTALANRAATAITKVRLYEDLEIAKEQAEAADRLKSAFLATMSHELRTPLNSIIGFTGIVLQGLPGPLNPEQTKQLGMVQNSARHLLALINDVLDISKIEAGQLEIVAEPFDMRAAIETVAQSVIPLLEKKGLALEVELAPEVGRIANDRRRVEQVLLNLVNNAIKFTERGEVRVVCRVDDDRLVTRVTDTGIGIKPEDLGRLFQPFQQAEHGLARQYEGTGLGLSICKKLVEMMGGEIWVESEWGVGSTFTFILPVAPVIASERSERSNPR